MQDQYNYYGNNVPQQQGGYNNRTQAQQPQTIVIQDERGRELTRIVSARNNKPGSRTSVRRNPSFQNQVVPQPQQNALQPYTIPQQQQNALQPYTIPQQQQYSQPYSVPVQPMQPYVDPYQSYVNPVMIQPHQAYQGIQYTDNMRNGHYVQDYDDDDDDDDDDDYDDDYHRQRDDHRKPEIQTKSKGRAKALDNFFVYNEPGRKGTKHNLSQPVQPKPSDRLLFCCKLCDKPNNDTCFCCWRMCACPIWWILIIVLFVILLIGGAGAVLGLIAGGVISISG